MKSAPAIKVVGGVDTNYGARCLACQGGHRKTSADVNVDPCEYCSGMCLDGNEQHVYRSNRFDAYGLLSNLFASLVFDRCCRTIPTHATSFF